MSCFKTFVIATGVSAVSISAAAAATTFTDVSAFGAATTNLTTENFDNDIAGPTVFDTDTTITFDSGTTSTATNNQQFNEVDDGQFRGGTRAGRTDEFDRTITFDFGTSITAFGGLFEGASDIIISGIFDGQQESLLIGDIRSDDGFFGLTSSTGFSTVTFSTDTGGFLPFGNPTVSLQAINFRLDDLMTGDALDVAPPAVPLPASVLMLLSAVGGMGAIRRFSRRRG